MDKHFKRGLICLRETPMLMLALTIIVSPFTSTTRPPGGTSLMTTPGIRLQYMTADLRKLLKRKGSSAHSLLI
jgi:hypothetical protein